MRKKIIRYLIYIATKLFLKIVILFPYKIIINVGEILGRISFNLLNTSRIDVIQNLKKSFPEKNDKEIVSLAKNVYKHLGKTLFEFFYFPKINKIKINKIISAKGLHYLDEALEKGKGVIISSGHIGNWEFLGAYLSLNGYPINVVAKRTYDDRLNDILVLYRQSKGVKTFLRKESTRDIIKALKNQEVIGILTDQDTDVKGCFVDFFGRLAYTPAGLALIALKYDIPIVPAAIRRFDDNKHEITVLPCLKLIRTGDMEQDIVLNTQKITSINEEFIRKAPEQWVWVHKRWKTQ